MEPIEQSSSGRIWYVVGAIVVIAVLALWFFSSTPSQAPGTSSSALQETQESPLSGGNSIADISADLNQAADGSALLDQDAAASASAIQDF